jgi:hypothetical protein
MAEEAAAGRNVGRLLLGIAHLLLRRVPCARFILGGAPTRATLVRGRTSQTKFFAAT